MGYISGAVLSRQMITNCKKKKQKLLYFLYEIYYMYILYIDIYVPHKHTCTCATDVLCDDDLCVRVCLYACAICCSS